MKLEIFYTNFHVKDGLQSNGIHSLLRRADARASADIIYRSCRSCWCISLLCGWGI